MVICIEKYHLSKEYVLYVSLDVAAMGAYLIASLSKQDTPMATK